MDQSSASQHEYSRAKAGMVPSSETANELQNIEKSLLELVRSSLHLDSVLTSLTRPSPATTTPAMSAAASSLWTPAAEPRRLMRLQTPPSPPGPAPITQTGGSLIFYSPTSNSFNRKLEVCLVPTQNVDKYAAGANTKLPGKQDIGFHRKFAQLKTSYFSFHRKFAPVQSSYFRLNSTASNCSGDSSMGNGSVGPDRETLEPLEEKKETAGDYESLRSLSRASCTLREGAQIYCCSSEACPREGRIYEALPRGPHSRRGSRSDPPPVPPRFATIRFRSGSFDVNPQFISSYVFRQLFFCSSSPSALCIPQEVVHFTQWSLQQPRGRPGQGAPRIPNFRGGHRRSGNLRRRRYLRKFPLNSAKWSC